MTITLHPKTALAILIAALALTAWKIALSRPAVHTDTPAPAAASAAEWSPIGGRLMTRFSADVTPEKVRPEYPRPQLQRQDWMNLNGVWELAFDDANAGETGGWKSGKAFAERILVPFTFESALSGLGRGDEIHERLWYRRSFTTPDTWSGKRVLLNFGAVDWEACVYVNGREVGRHKGGYTPFSVDITDALSGSGPQELVVRVFDPSEKNPLGWQPRGKQRGSDGIWYTRTTGIWQSVWLEPVADAHLSQIALTPGADSAVGTLAIDATLPASANGATLEVSIDGELDTDKTGAPLIAQSVPVTSGHASLFLRAVSAKLWTPESPTLYGVTYRLTRDGRVLDQARGYTAFRRVGVANGRLTLNGKPYFYRGVLDQGFWPDGIYTPPSDDAIRDDVEMTKKLGFNMARKHVKVDDPRWYYWCDKLGLAVWQDMPSPNSLKSDEARREYEQEWTETIAATRSYPCVVHWIPFNENWGDPGAFQDDMVALTRRLDPSRTITDASGWTQRDHTDVIDHHNYSDRLRNEGEASPKRPRVVGEYGGVGLTIDGHIWSDGRIYIHAKNPGQMLQILRRRTSELYRAQNLSGFVYTQLTDVEQELNGLETYDREPKADVAAIARIIRGEDQDPASSAIAIRDWLTLGPIPAGVTVGALDSTPASLSAMGQILDTAYVANEPSLTPRAGQSVTVGGQTLSWRAVHEPELDFTRLLPGGPHENAVAYAVASIDCEKAFSNVTLHLGSDDGAVVWLNGKRVHRMNAVRGVTEGEDRISGLSLRAGRNVLVVKVGQGGGGWGLTAGIEKR